MPVQKDNQRGTWMVQFEYQDWLGKRKHITKRGFATKREAVQWETERKLKITGSLDMSFKDFIQIYKDNRLSRLREGTISTKENIIDTKIIPYLGTKKLGEITATDILQWQNTLLKLTMPGTNRHYSQSYLKTIHNQLSAIFNHAVKYYGLKENPARIAGNMGSEKEIKMNFWTQEQYQQFAEVMMDYPLAYYCFEMLYWSGIREGELLALLPNDLDLKAKTVSISKTFYQLKGKDIVGEPKTKKSNRIVVLPDFLCDELQDYIEMIYDLHPTERLFPVTKSFLYRMMRLGCDQANLPHIRVHDLRHSHVSLLINMGFSAVAIADRVGHESIDITYRYAHLFPSIQSEMGTKLNELRKEENDV